MNKKKGKNSIVHIAKQSEQFQRQRKKKINVLWKQWKMVNTTEIFVPHPVGLQSAAREWEIFRLALKVLETVMDPITFSLKVKDI
jgi:hypothetical protein